MIAQIELRDLIMWKVLAVTAVYILIAIFLLAWVLPNYQKALLLDEELEGEYALQANLERIVERRSSLEKERDGLKEAVAQLENVIPAAEDLPLILEYLKAISAVSKTKMDDFSFTPQKLGELGEEIMLHTSLAGSYREIWGFLYLLQDTLPTLRVTDLSLESQGDKVLQAEINFIIKLRKDIFVEEWQKPIPDEYNRMVHTDLWGLPSSVVREFWSEETKVLGIVRTEGAARALIKRGNQQKWVRPGDEVGPSVVETIESQAVVLRMNEIRFRLKMGG